MSEKVAIYGMIGCPYTEKAKKNYKKAEYFDVKQDPVKLDEMLQHSKGVRKVPVIVAGGKVSIGYGGS
ncbi:MAG TPA: UXX-star (seleno)protein family 1 [Candidatus Sulfobium mesophilum]|nr:UXX-star (seleno)protein family 1 [Candidatus Sulfobium mesophilum]